jgi:hypothetical protein
MCVPGPQKGHQFATNRGTIHVLHGTHFTDPLGDIDDGIAMEDHPAVLDPANMHDLFPLGVLGRHDTGLMGLDI